MKLAELRWESKPDGSYLTINEEEKVALQSIDIEEALLKAGYLNADPKRISQVIESASDKSEFIGARLALFDRRKNEFAQIDVQKTKVALEILPTIEEQNFELTTKDIEFLLKQRKIAHGVDWTLISQILNRKKWDDSFIIAQDTAPIKGEDARVIEMVKLDRESKPLRLDDGSVDFRNLDSIVQVKEGQLLARRVPPKMGTDGTDIYGNPIPADAGDEMLLPRGLNTEVIKEESELVASVEGYLFPDGKNFGIGQLFIVPGDLNFKIGNIKYKGDVVIRGSVLPDFIVEADGDVTIEGSVEAATIKAGGSISIKSGVYGKNKAIIEAGKSIRVNQAQDATLIAQENLYFSNVLTDCKIEAQSVYSKSLSAVMQSCELRVTQQVKVAQIGSPTSNASRIEFYDPEEKKIQDQIQDAYTKKNQIQIQLEGFGRHLKSMKAIIAKAESITPRTQEEVKKVFLQFQSTKTKIDLLDKKMANLNKQKKDATHFKAKISSKLIFPILEVQMLQETFEIKDALKDLQVYWENKRINKKESNFSSEISSIP